MAKPCAQLIARCFAVRTHSHLHHLVTKSYADHKALGHFYEDLVDAVDEYAEAHMAVYGKLEYADFPALRPPTGAVRDSIADLRTWIASHREECCGSYDDSDEDKETEREEVESPELASLIDNILVVVDRALYKLKNLA